MRSGKVYWNVLVALALSAGALWFVSARQPAQGQETKPTPPSVAVVDNEKIEQNYKLFQAKRDELQKLADDRRRELEARAFLDEDEWRKLEELMAKKNPSNADKKEMEKIISAGLARKDEWQELIGKVNLDEKQSKRRSELERIQKLNKSKVDDKYEVYSKEIDELQKSTLDDLFNKVKESIGYVARQRGYSVVVLKQSVIWSADAVDITEEVLKQLNSNDNKKR
ncbi:MAG: OmpH family outer membrane protein [Abditibacteriales bacterium]|nr:OmpH family outer membrane protein [Abditibacteriales bacterium]MDW8366547.1 OmpH family outer membrane protein [Abditibacteriales bacterium]